MACFVFVKVISIHAPCEGGDISVSGYVLVKVISIHAPCEGGDDLFERIQRKLDIFQSTPPVKGATRLRGRALNGRLIFQSTPPVKGATALYSEQPLLSPAISIHAPCEGGDSLPLNLGMIMSYFNPRPL